MDGLAVSGSKDNRIKLTKIRDYMKVLSLYGTRAGQPYVKHLEGDIWELRPLRDRILFFCWDGKRFVLLHQFIKKTQKTPKKEIEQVTCTTTLRGVMEMSKNKISPRGMSWDEYEKKVFTPDEIAASDLRVALISELIEARQKNGYTQKDMEAMTGVRQPVIVRLEHGTTDPQLSTLLKVLAPLGKTLAIVPLPKD